MNLNNIPLELRQRPQWVVWRPLIRTDEQGQTKVTKPPYQVKNLHYGANVNDPATWATFEEAVDVMQANPSLVSGIGYVFSPNDPFFGIDIDDEEGISPENMPKRKVLVNEILEKAITYTEISPSGKGLHLIARGETPVSGKRSTALKIEVYGSGRYFTITGDIYAGRNVITDQQDFANRIFAVDLKQQEELGRMDITSHRRNDLTDEEVLREASNLNPTFAPRYNAQVDCEPGAWSETFMAVVGILDQITGKYDQLVRLVMQSPMVTQAPPSSAGEPRSAKAARNFDHVLARVRNNNTHFLSAVEHGKRMWEGVQKKRAEDAERNAREILEQAEAAFSKNGVELLKAFPLKSQHLTLTPPPGLAGGFVQATMNACYNPFLKFAIPATLSTLSGILGRMYKLPSGQGLNMNFIMAAATSTGKTQTMDAWEIFLTDAARQIENNLQGPSRTRLIKASASSIQGIFEDFMETPAAVWFISECASQLAQMSNPRSNTDGQLRDAYNDLYDAARLGKYFSPPRSVANRKANLEPIRNLSISTFWTTTVSKFDLFSDDAQDGFLSRVIIIRHNGRAGDIRPTWEVNTHMDDLLFDALRNMMAAAKRFDETWDMSIDEALKLVTTINASNVEGRAWAFQQVTERIKNAALSGDLPIAYVAVSRLPVTALRLAGLLAVLDSPFSPSITEEHFDWAFGYLLQNLVSVLSDIDRGELGASMSKDVEVVVREMKKIMRKSRSMGVGKTELYRVLKQLKPFKDAMPTPGQALARTLNEMQEQGLVSVVQQVSEGRGRPKEVISPSNDALWREI